METDFRHTTVGIDKHPRRRAKARVENIIGEVATGVQFKETAEGTRTHPSDVGQLIKTQFVTIITADEILHFQHTTAVIISSYFCKTRCGKCPRTVTFRQFIKNRKKLGDSIKTLFDRAQGVEQAIDFHDGFDGKGKTSTCLIHHPRHREKRCPSKYRILIKGKVKLNGDFTDMVTHTLMLLPHMLQIRTGNKH